jgi:predicted CoA-substrate-specific enzyme activase
MIALGCDIGSLFSKAVIMDDDKPLASRVMETTGNIAQDVHGLIQAVCDEAGIDQDALYGIVGTGGGREFVTDASSLNAEHICIGKAACNYIPELDFVVDIGGESITAILLDDEGDIKDIVRNDKCASGSGSFLDIMLDAVGVPIDMVDEVVAKSTKSLPITSQCGVFVESEVISHVNNSERPEDITAGLCDSIARVVTSVARRFKTDKTYTFTGGVAKLRAVVDLIHPRLDGEYIPFPLDPQLATAIGAALLVRTD